MIDSHKKNIFRHHNFLKTRIISQLIILGILRLQGLHVELGATGGVVTTAQSRGNSSLPLYHVPGAPSKSFRCLGRDCCECNCFVCYLMLGMLGFVIFW